MNQQALTPPITTREESEELCSTMQETLVRLIDVLKTEISLVKNRQAKDMSTLVSEKNTLTNMFLKMFSQLKANAAIIGRYSPKQVAKLRRMITQFNEVMRSNLAALSAAKSVNETLIDTIVDLTSQNSKAPQAYTSGGYINKPAANKPAPIAVNKVL